jgi:hypothetical protein
MNKAPEDEKEERITQEGCTGILMVGEAEVTMDLKSIENVLDAVTKSLEKAGF